MNANFNERKKFWMQISTWKLFMDRHKHLKPETYPIFPLTSISISIRSLHWWPVVFRLRRRNGLEGAWGWWLGGWRTDLSYFRWLNIIGLCSWIISTGMINEKWLNSVSRVQSSGSNREDDKGDGDNRQGKVTKLKPMCCMMKSRD